MRKVFQKPPGKFLLTFNQLEQGHMLISVTANHWLLSSELQAEVLAFEAEEGYDLTLAERGKVGYPEQ